MARFDIDLGRQFTLRQPMSLPVFFKQLSEFVVGSHVLFLLPALVLNFELRLRGTIADFGLKVVTKDQALPLPIPSLRSLSLPRLPSQMPYPSSKAFRSLATCIIPATM